eukprot:scaffold11111_cov151-Skeletonema_dohrnii-CCMP3373.AAC.2
MPVAIAILVAAVKAGGLLIGSIVHEVGQHFGNDHKTAKALCLPIKDAPLCLQDSSNVTPSNAVVLYASRSIMQSSSSRVLVSLDNDSEEKSQLDKLVNNLCFIVPDYLKIFAEWYCARIIVMMQSATRLFITDIKEAIASSVGSTSESDIDTKANASISCSCLFQMISCWFLAKIIYNMNKATHLFMSCAGKDISKLLGQGFPNESQANQSCKDFDLTQDNTPDRSSTVGDVGTIMLRYPTMFIAYFKRTFVMLFEHNWSGLLHTGQHSSVKVSSLMYLMLFVGVSIIGWSIPFTLIDGKPEGSTLQQSLNSFESAGLETSLDLELEARVCDPIAFPSTSPNANGVVASSPSSIFANFYSVSTYLQANESPEDIDPGLDDYARSLPIWSDDEVGTDPISQTIYHWNNETEALSQIAWKAESTHWIQSRATLEIFVLEWVPGEVLFLASRRFALKHFTLLARKEFEVADSMDETYSSFSIAQSPQAQFFVEVNDRSPSISVSDGRSSITQMMSPPRGHSVIQYPFKEFDGSADSLHTSFYPHLTLPCFVTDRVRGLSQALLVSSNDLSKDLAQPGLSLFSSTASNVHPKIDQLAVLLRGKTALNVLKGATSINVLELRHLAFVLLLLLYNDSDSDSGVNANEAESTQDSEIPADLEEATEDEAACIHEGNEAEEDVDEDVPNTTCKSPKGISNVLHSELGRHWKSPSKRRWRSSRTRSKPKYYEPA